MRKGGPEARRCRAPAAQATQAPARPAAGRPPRAAVAGAAPFKTQPRARPTGGAAAAGGAHAPHGPGAPATHEHLHAPPNPPPAPPPARALGAPRPVGGRPAAAGGAPPYAPAHARALARPRGASRSGGACAAATAARLSIFPAAFAQTRLAAGCGCGCRAAGCGPWLRAGGRPLAARAADEAAGGALGALRSAQPARAEAVVAPHPPHPPHTPASPGNLRTVIAALRCWLKHRAGRWAMRCRTVLSGFASGAGGQGAGQRRLGMTVRRGAHDAWPAARTSGIINRIYLGSRPASG